MSERYYITGVQIGIIQAKLEQIRDHNFKSNFYGRKQALDKTTVFIDKLLEGIVDKQFVGRIENDKQEIMIIDPEKSKHGCGDSCKCKKKLKDPSIEAQIIAD